MLLKHPPEENAMPNIFFHKKNPKSKHPTIYLPVLLKPGCYHNLLTGDTVIITVLKHILLFGELLQGHLFKHNDTN